MEELGEKGGHSRPLLMNVYDSSSVLLNSPHQKITAAGGIGGGLLLNWKTEDQGTHHIEGKLCPLCLFNIFFK